MKSFFRIFYVVYIFCTFGLFDLVKIKLKSRFIRLLLFFIPKTSKVKGKELPIRLRLALEHLGPIYVKFGQLLSTRPDIIPSDFIYELVKLQDKVPPFPGEIAKKEIIRSIGKNLEEIFFSFNMEPVASASIAQVHEAYLLENGNQKGGKVAVKVLRPNIEKIIATDIDMLFLIVKFINKIFNDAKRLRLVEVVNEFKYYLNNEVNLMNEAANANLFKRQFVASNILIIPKVYLDYCTDNVLVLEWMNGIHVNDIEQLKSKNIDLTILARNGIEIFFTQVFKNGFFHADMHPGNILVADDGKYIALDFGIVGTLTDFDKKYLSINFLAFFDRDYRRVATAHIESGWVPKDTNILELEAAVRRVCEPYINQPLSKISFGTVLLKLFDTSRRFHVEIQPQLVLLQKTLLNVEGLGRQLDPSLDLWVTARPILEKWIKEQVGFKAFINHVKEEYVDWAEIFATLPRKVNNYLESNSNNEERKLLLDNLISLKKIQSLQSFIIIILLSLLIVLAIFLIIYFNIKF